jgi:hypothetical protein
MTVFWAETAAARSMVVVAFKGLVTRLLVSRIKGHTRNLYILAITLELFDGFERDIEYGEVNGCSLIAVGRLMGLIERGF